MIRSLNFTGFASRGRNTVVMTHLFIGISKRKLALQATASRTLRCIPFYDFCFLGDQVDLLFVSMPFFEWFVCSTNCIK
jgi:hypothetical protein